MGLKLTEEIRKLSGFFCKRFPLDVKERHIKTPSSKEYFTNKFACILGGTFESKSDLLDKILLAN